MGKFTKDYMLECLYFGTLIKKTHTHTLGTIKASQVVVLNKDSVVIPHRKLM